MQLVPVDRDVALTVSEQDDAGVQHVELDRQALGTERLTEPCNRGEVRQIQIAGLQRRGGDGLPDAVQHRLPAAAIAHGKDDVCPLGGERTSDLPTDAAARPRHERTPTLPPSGHVRPSAR